MTTQFRQFVSQYQDQVYSLALYLLRSRSEAEDLTQDVFTKLWQHLEQIDVTSAKPWLMKVTRNQCLDRLRQRRQYCAVEESTLVDDKEPSESLMQEQLSVWLRDAIAKLKEPYQSLIVLRDLQQHSYEHIGQILALNLNQVKSYLFRARRQLRELLQEVEP